jgi:small nuclear ribonucleoprotein (snRNP)-like protein
MDWKDWTGKIVFIKTKSGSVYSGKVIDVDNSSNPLIFISLIDKFGKEITIEHSEIIKIVEEGK